jgi:hypothetical protein
LVEFLLEQGRQLLLGQDPLIGLAQSIERQAEGALVETLRPTEPVVDGAQHQVGLHGGQALVHALPYPKASAISLPP